MKDFVASNGIPVALTNETPSGAMLTTSEKDGTYPYTNARGDDVQALREFFQAEADERLGRWRWPENPDYVVYPIPGADESVKSVRVFRESTSAVGFYYLTDSGENTTENMGHAARAYFDAHPEPKPWTRAKEGESWYLTITSLGPETSLRWLAQGSPVRFWSGGLHISADSNEITDGRPVNTGMS